MIVVLPHRIEAMLSPTEARLDLAIGTYSRGRVTMGTAAGAADRSIPQFQRELGRRRIPVNHTAENLDLSACISDVEGELCFPCR